MKVEGKPTQKSITYLEKEGGVIHGISSGYKTGDIEIRPDWFDSKENNGDFTVSGTCFY